MLEAAGRAILLDFGASSLVALNAHGIDARTIDAIVLSHLHGDHYGGIPFLLLDAQLLNCREKPLVIAGPPGTRDRIRAAQEVFFPRSSGITWAFDLDIREIVPGVPEKLFDLLVATIEVVHPSGAPSTAIRVSDGHRLVAYSGDTEWTDALIDVAKDADLFIVECYEYDRQVPAHLNWKTLKARLPELRAHRVMLTHMNPSMLAHVDEARSAGLLIAEDGAVIEL
jgi:ribonuclease BN (tRNA processing enzyme)